jgi:DNA mismatch repair protein MutS
MPKKENFSIYSHYFSVTQENVKKYGEDTIVYMQVGGFYELYGCKQGDIIIGSKIEEVSAICDLQCKEKKVSFEGDAVYMAGIPLNSLDKYIEKTIHGGFTAVVYVQSDDKEAKDRLLDSVYSPGTYISDSNQTSASNNIMCVWVDHHKSLVRKVNKPDTLSVGISVVDTMTGATSFYQYETEYNIIASNFDELQRYVSVYNPSEFIIACSITKKHDVQKIMDYSGICSSKIHYVDMNGSYAKNVPKQTYQNHIISDAFQADTFDICLEFREKDTATKAYCYLLDFVKERNPQLVNRLTLPTFDNVSTRVTLANHTLMQLNIIDDIANESKRYGKKSSVMSFLNQCSTIIGKRRFRHLMTNPTTDEEWLHKEYRMIDYLVQDDNYNVVDYLRHSLVKIKDIEKISRQIVIRKLFPCSISQLYGSIMELDAITSYISDKDTLNNYLVSKQLPYNIEDKYEKIENLLSKYFIIEECDKVSSNSGYSGNIIIRLGIFEEYDDIVKQYRDRKFKFDSIHKFLNDITNKMGNAGDSDDDDDKITYVKVHRTEKTGSYLESTLSRSKTVKAALKKYEANPENKPVEGIRLADIKFVSGTSGNKKIESEIVSNLSWEIVKLEEKLTKITVKLFGEILDIIEKEIYTDLRDVANYVGKMDLIQCKAYNARTRNYCKPEIQNHTTSFVEAKQLRHCLIEYLQQNELYVPNDIQLGKEPSGILLYGTNAVGKTSLIRALGISVIMAQCGMYVPCSEFVFKPYTALFSRILGNDNLFRGLSTFAVEMSELRVILNNADRNSLILGDELCSGTELQSALSIFVSGLQRLHNRRSSFIFATHFHDVIYYDEIKDLDSIAIKHMEVTYNSQLDALVYDRILKDGPGNNTYGLEVCKSLHLDTEFLDCAYQIRNKYFKESSGALQYNPTRYNATKLVGKCEMCGETMGTETHHLAEQQTANKDGFIDSFHKNHKANLVSICEKCHDKEHSQVHENPKRKKKTTSGQHVIA